MLKAIDDLHWNGIKVFSSTLDSTKKVFDIDFKEPCCIVMGGEDKGVQPYLNKACDELFSIPMAGAFDSFNVSVATGIILYEAMKQKMPVQRS